MGKFECGPDERLYLEGYCVYLKSSVSIYQGDAYLTSKRFVYCRKNRILYWLLLGPVLGMLTKGKNIIFELNLQEIKSIVKQKHGMGSKYVIGAADGRQFPIQFMSRKDLWVETLTDLVKRARPEEKVEAVGEAVYFG